MKETGCFLTLSCLNKIVRLTSWSSRADAEPSAVCCSGGRICRRWSLQKQELGGAGENELGAKKVLRKRLFWLSLCIFVICCFLWSLLPLEAWQQSVLDPKSCQCCQIAKLCLLLSKFQKGRLHYIQFTRSLVGRLSTPPLIFPLRSCSPPWTKYFPPFLFLTKHFPPFPSPPRTKYFPSPSIFLIFLLHLYSFFPFSVFLLIRWLNIFCLQMFYSFSFSSADLLFSSN